MEIPNYDKKETTNNFKQLYDYMPDRCFRMLICRKTGCGKTNTVLHMLIKPLIYYDKIYVYSKNLEQEKYTHLSEKLERIAKVNKIPIDEILHHSNEEIKPISEMEEDRNQKVVIFDDYVCEKNQRDIINYFIQGRYKNYCVINISQLYYKTPKYIRLNCSHYIIIESPSKRENEAISNEQGLDKEACKRSFEKEHIFYILITQERLPKGFFMGNYNIWDYSIIL